MHPATISLMHDQVRAIYRALTGSDMPESSPSAADSNALPGQASSDLSPDEIARRFAELESIARAIPAVVERVPPFSFAPPLDAYEMGRELVIDIAVSGVERGDFTVERTDDLLILSGVRRGERAANGRLYLHAEIPRGPFHRVIRLPYRTGAEPRVTVKDGLIRIQLSKTATATA